jgi:hypothetical protein
MKYSIRIKKLGNSFKMYYPLLVLPENFGMLQEINRCNTDYILDEVLPNLKKIWKGELVQDPTIQEVYLQNYYPFGYDATIIDFYKNISIINYNFFEDKMEIASEEIYHFMMEWGKYLDEWRKR